MSPVVIVKLDALREYLLLEVELVFGLEGRVATEKDIEDDSDRPPIHLLVVFHSRKYLGGHVEGCADG